MSKLRVLFVDDEPDIREVATLSLELDPDIEAKAVGTAGEALEILARGLWSPHVVLLDMMMGGIDGLSGLRLLRSIEGCEALPVIFITARSRDSDIARYLAAGAKAVITKPFSPLTLAQQIRTILAE